MVDDFGEELARERPWLFSVALRITARRDEAEDLVQDTVERALRFRGHFDGRNLRGWLITVMRHRRLDLARREQLRQAADVDQLQQVLIGGDVERQAIAHLQLEQVLRTARDPVLRLSLMMSTQEMAAALQRSKNRIQTRLRNARIRARRLVGS